MGHKQWKTLVVAAATMALGLLLSACSSDPEAKATTCGLDSEPFVDAIGDNHFSVRETDTTVPFKPTTWKPVGPDGELANDRSYFCSLSVDDKDAMTVMGRIDLDDDGVYSNDEPEDDEFTFSYAGGKGFADSISGFWRCEDVVVSVSLDPDDGSTSDDDSTSAIETIVKGLAERVGCASF